MGASSLAVAVAFHAMRGMYLHAERLLAKAGRQSARGGVSPIRSKAEDERSEGLHKRSAEDCWETPCAAPGQSPQPRFGFLIRACQRTWIFRVGRCGAGTGPAVVGGGRRGAAVAREETSSLISNGLYNSEHGYLANGDARRLPRRRSLQREVLQQRCSGNHIRSDPPNGSQSIQSREETTALE